MSKKCKNPSCASNTIRYFNFCVSCGKKEVKKIAEEKKKTKILNFLKEAFCIDGECIMVDEAVDFEGCFKLVDSKRGAFYVGLSTTKPL